MSNSKAYPIMEDTFIETEKGAVLIAGKCPSCGTYSFPKFCNAHKPNCRTMELDTVHLTRKGRLDSFVIQNYAPPPPFVNPDPYVPFAVGLVEFPEGIKVLGMMTGCKLEEIKINMQVEVVIEPLHKDEKGCDVLTWKFKPVK